jgi:hypothetical protein
MTPISIIYKYKVPEVERVPVRPLTVDSVSIS